LCVHATSATYIYTLSLHDALPIYAEAFRTASAYNGRNAGRVDHEIIGELLGFPACCAKNFVDKWAEGFFDPVWQSAIGTKTGQRSEEHTSELQSRENLVCRLLLEK